MNDSIKNKEIIIPFKTIEIAAIVYLMLPIAIFMLTWTKIYIGIIAVIMMSVAAYSMVKTIDDKTALIISRGSFWIIVVITVLWVYFSGVGGFFVNAFDMNWRNAVYRDLINYSWPVVYENGNALVYYLFFWLVPALVGKCFGWTAANVALSIWLVIGILLIVGLISIIVNAKTKTEYMVIIFMLIFWGGLDVVGAIIVQILNKNAYSFGLWDCNVWMDYFWNGHPFNFSYRTNHNALSNVFNQAPAVWISTALCYINREKLQNYIFLGMLMLPFAPVAFIGVVVLLVIYYIYWVIVIKGYLIESIKQIFSMQNMLIIVAILPVVGAYYVSNSATSEGGISLLTPSMMSEDTWVGIILFWLLSFAIIALLIGKEYKREPLFYIINIWLLVDVFIVFGKSDGRDFCMNASLSAFFILMVYTIKYVNKHIVNSVMSFRNVLILFYLFWMLMSPLFNVLGGIDQIKDRNEFPLYNDSIITFADKDINDTEMLYYNFLCGNKEKSIFYKYMSR